MRGLPLLGCGAATGLLGTYGVKNRLAIRGKIQPAADYFQLKIGGDLAAVKGMTKCVPETDKAALQHRHTRVIDAAFIEQHCANFDAFSEDVLNES